MVAPEEQIFAITDFKGGINTSVPTSRIADNELRDALNVEIDASGALMPMPSTVDLVTNVGNIVSLIGFYHNGANSTLSYLLYYRTSGANTELVALSSAGTTTVLASFAGNLSAERQNAQVFEYNNKAYIVPGPTGLIYEINETAANVFTVAAVAGTPNLVNAFIFKDRMFGSIAESQRLLFSDPGVFGTWGGTSFIDIESVDPSPITAFEAVNDVLYIFKQYSIWALYVQGDPANWTLRLINGRLGATNKRAVVAVEGNIYFADFKGIYSTDGLDFQDIGYKAFYSQLFRATTPISLSQAEIVQFGDRIVVRHSTVANDAVYVFYFRINAWVRWVLNILAIKHLVLNNVITGNFKNTLFFATVSNTLVYVDTTTLKSTGMSVITKAYDFGMPSVMKKVKFWALEYAGTMDIDSLQASLDGAVETFAVTLEEVATLGSKFHKFGGEQVYFRSAYFTINFTNSGGNVIGTIPPTVLGLFAHYEGVNRVVDTR